MRFLKFTLYIVLILAVILGEPFSLNSTLDLLFILWTIFVIRCLLFKKAISIYNSFLPFSLLLVSLIFYSKFSTYSYQQLSLIFIYISVFALTQDLISPGDIKKLIQLLGIIVITYTVIESIWVLPYLRRALNTSVIKNMHHLKYILSKQRTTAFFLTPNNLGIFLLFVLYAFWEQEKKFFKFFISGIIFFCLLTTKSIGVWLCLGITILIALPLLGYKKYALAGAIFSLGIAGIVIYLRRDLIFNLHNLYFNPFYQRIKMWEKTLELISTRPLRGYGLGNFPLWYNLNLPHYLNQEIYAHNLFLQFWFESGIVGYLWVIFFYFFILREIFRKLKENFFLSLSCLTFLIHNLFDASFYLPKVGIFFWIFLALLLNTPSQVQK